jgi:hypothetical protein
MTFLEAKKIVEGKGYHVVKNSEGETFRQRVAREELEEAMKVVKQAGLNVINENDLTNFAQFDSNGNITATQDFEDDKMILSANFNDNTDDEDMSPYDAELTIQFKKKFRTAHHVERHIYNSLCRKLQQFGYTDAMDDSYNNGKTKTLKFNFFFDDNTNAETIINIMVRSAKLWTAQLGESLESDEDLDELDEGCCGGDKKKKGKKKGKKSDFVPFWAKKKDKVDEALEDDLDLEGMTLDEGMILDEGFGSAEGTPLSQLCADYIQDNYFTKLANEVGLEAAKAEFLEKAREVTGDKYYKTLSARIQAAKTATAVLFVLQGTMFGGSNMDLAAGTRQSAYHRNRR